MSTAPGFARFYRSNVPTVFGYVLRLCGGDRPLAEDLTQEVFFALTAQVKVGKVDAADVRWLLTVARHRFLDHLRREQRQARQLSQLRLVPPDDAVDDERPSRADVLEHLTTLEPMHRVVLMMRYVDGLPVEAIARDIARSVPATYSLLARARMEMRRSREEAT